MPGLPRSRRSERGNFRFGHPCGFVLAQPDNAFRCRTEVDGVLADMLDCRRHDWRNGSPQMEASCGCTTGCLS